MQKMDDDMMFSEKLSKLFALTETQGLQLAQHVGCDPSQVSRMKTGERKRPHDLDTMRAISDFFASHCDDGCRLSGLAALTENYGILIAPSTQVCSDAILVWLNSDNISTEPVSRFLLRLASFDMQAPPVKPHQRQTMLFANGSNNTAVFTDNSGKRQAVLALLERVLDIGEAHEFYMLTDEDETWLWEDFAFVRIYAGYINELVGNGCVFYRLAPPNRNARDSFRDMELWLPAYASCSVREFYYPKPRDDLHRRTLFVVNGIAAVSSRSIGERESSSSSMLSTDERIVSVAHMEALDLLRMCKPRICPHSVTETEAILRNQVSDDDLQTPYMLLSDAPLNTSISIYAKTSDTVLIVKDREPFISLCITDVPIAASIHDYLNGSLKNKRKRASRSDWKRTLQAGQ